MSIKNRALTTAYSSNTRNSSERKVVSYAHNQKIKELLEKDYSFLPICYRRPGFMFRGLESGLRLACEKGHFGLNTGQHSLAHLERDLGVLLVSADFSDAYTVSRFWESVDDAVILVVSADYFFAQYQQHQAATLGFAEPGVVFKYPFLCNAINLQDIAYFIVLRSGAESLMRAFNGIGGKQARSLHERLIILDADPGERTRHMLGQHLDKYLDARKIVGAKAIQAENYPKRSG